VKWPLLTLMIFGVVYSFFAGFQADIAYSGEMSDEMKKMQEQLNNQVLSKPFSVADEAQVKAYIEDAQRRGEMPQAYSGMTAAGVLATERSGY
jgi:hypothetical protein